MNFNSDILSVIYSFLPENQKSCHLRTCKIFNTTFQNDTFVKCMRNGVNRNIQGINIDINFCMHLCETDNVIALKYIFENVPHRFPRRVFKLKRTELHYKLENLTFIMACAIGAVNIVEYIFNNNIFICSVAGYTDGLCNAIFNNNTKIINLVIAQPNKISWERLCASALQFDNKEIYSYVPRDFKMQHLFTFIHTYLDKKQLVQFIIDNNLKTKEQIFYTCCKLGKVSMVKWLYEKYKLNVTMQQICASSPTHAVLIWALCNIKYSFIELYANDSQYLAMSSLQIIFGIVCLVSLMVSKIILDMGINNNILCLMVHICVFFGIFNIVFADKTIETESCCSSLNLNNQQVNFIC